MIKKARQWVKRSRWVLLKNRDNLNRQQDSYLTEILKMNQELMTTYVLGAQLKELWRCESELEAKNLWTVWWEQVNESGIKPLKRVCSKAPALPSWNNRLSSLSAKYLHP